MAVIFQFIIYVRGSNYYYSPQAPKNIAMQLVSCSCPRHEAYRKNKDMAPLILNLSTRISCVASITPRSQSRYWWFWGRSCLVRLPGYETTPSSLQMVAKPTTLPRLHLWHIPVPNSTCLPAMLHHHLTVKTHNPLGYRAVVSHTEETTLIKIEYLQNISHWTQLLQPCVATVSEFRMAVTSKFSTIRNSEMWVK